VADVGVLVELLQSVPGPVQDGERQRGEDLPRRAARDNRVRAGGGLCAVAGNDLAVRHDQEGPERRAQGAQNIVGKVKDALTLD
jgi:hypothetical protein